MKALHDGTIVLEETPTKLVDGKRIILTDEEIILRKQEESEFKSSKAERGALDSIQQLEAQITNRRLRESILGVDGGWLQKQEELIKIERAKLKKDIK